MPEDIEDYEKQTVEVDDLQTTDIKINPDYYIHKALLKCIDSLNDENYKEGTFKYVQQVEFIERMTKAADKLPEKYNEDIKEYIDKLKDDPNKLMKIAHKKVELLMTEVFKTKTITQPLKL